MKNPVIVNSLFLKNVGMVFLILLFQPTWTDANSVFPDSLAFKGIEAVGVASIETKGMETVRLDTTLLHVAIRKQVRQAGIPVLSPRKDSSRPFEFVSDHNNFGVLLPIIIRWESAGPLGTTMNSFALTLHFLQPATIRPSNNEGWVITWTQTQSLLAGLKRPKEIERALEKMVQSFLVDFQQGRK